MSTNWSHFLPGRGIVPGTEESESNCYQPVTTKSSLSIQPESFDPSIDQTFIPALSSSPLPGMSRNPSDRSIDCLPDKDSLDASFRATDTRRNLIEKFEEIHTEPTDTVDTPVVKQTIKKESSSKMISPTCVAGLDQSAPEPIPMKGHLVTPDKQETLVALPRFEIHTDLKRELSDSLVDRVSFYAVIHDINKEATAMASNDESGYQRNPEELHEQYDPLVVAVKGQPKEPLPDSNSSVMHALIDEERWLLDAIDSRSADEARSGNACPPTFLQAMGEREYENPLTSLSNGSRTQLWKPSRSWWEAKSGKNPWIEPNSHNKRWRYLWPLIHYHKFLARCIKKLKRNGVDVKVSVSPVSVFLREEVCAVSDHLAGVSLFDSEQWMDCLQHFNGWTKSDPESEATIGELVGLLRLRPLTEPGDVDSALLRSQIDEHYLRAMATARAQMAGTGTEERRSNKSNSNGSSQQTPSGRSKKGGNSNTGHPPAYPRNNNINSPRVRGNSGNHGANSSMDARQQHWNYAAQGPQYWGGWPAHAQFHYGDDASVQSGLSVDSYPAPYNMGMYPGPMHNPYYPPPMMYPPQHPVPQGQPMPFDASIQDPRMYLMEGYHPEHHGASAWPMNQEEQYKEGEEKQDSPQPPKTPSSSAPTVVTPAVEQPKSATADGHPMAEQTPYKYNQSSPYWGHLDHTALALMATPQGISTPQTPHRGTYSPPDGTVAYPHPDDASGAVVNAQPLLLRQQYQSYGYYGNREAYGPPSPATQFMMSPQANFAYAYGAYGAYSPNQTSPSRQFSPSVKKRLDTTSELQEEPTPTSTPPPKAPAVAQANGPTDA